MNSDETLYEDYLKSWIKTKRYSIGPQTLKAQESYVKNQILPRLGQYTLSQISPMVMQDFVNTLIDHGLANTSVKRIVSIVSSSLDSAVRMQLIPKNPASLVNRPRLQRKLLQVWDIEQVRHFLALASKDPITHVAFHLALLTGMRQGEILGLRWKDVDLDGRILYVRQTLSHDGKEFLPGAKTRSGVRSIAVDKITAQVLEKHQQWIKTNRVKHGTHFQNEELVLCNQHGQRITPRTLMTVWYRLLQESGLPKITFHDLRHTHASLLLKNNVHPKIVSERLGHTSIQITLDTYSHLLPNMQKDAAGKLGEVLFNHHQDRSE